MIKLSLPLLQLLPLFIVASCSRESRDIEAYQDLKSSYKSLEYEYDLKGMDGELVTFWKVIGKVSESNRKIILNNIEQIQCNEYVYGSNKKIDYFFIKIKRENGSNFVISRADK